jgi:hypothetical protein
MQWQGLNDITAKLVDMPKDPPSDDFPDLLAINQG